MNDNNIILYDGDCGFCNFWVQWILKTDTENRFKFASLQGTFGQQFLIENNLPNEKFDTVYLKKNNKIYSKLNAVAEIGSTLGGYYKVFALLKILPNFISDPVYMAVSSNRKRLAAASCMLPTPKEREKFII